MASLASGSGQVASDGENKLPPILLRPTFSSGQVTFPGWEKEPPPATFHPAYKILQAWLDTQAKDDVIEKTTWTSDLINKKVSNGMTRLFLVANGKASTGWKKHLPLKKWTVTKYLVNDAGFRFMVILQEGMVPLAIDVAHGVDSFQVSGVCWAFT